MIDEKSLQDLPKATRTSFLQTHATSQSKIVSDLASKVKGDPTKEGAYNDAVLELNRINFFLAQAKLATT